MANQNTSTYMAFRGAGTTAAAMAYQPGFKIALRFRGGLTASQQRAFTLAANRWSRVIVGQLPKVVINNEVIDGLVIDAWGDRIDGEEGVLAATSPVLLRPSRAGASAFLPVTAQMVFDVADLAAMEANGTLTDVIAHEMGHAIGIGSLWQYKSLIRNAGGTDPWFMGQAASRAYALLRAPLQGPAFSPVENSGGSGTRDCHWREAVFRNELMTGYASLPGNRSPLSTLTVASLHDLGYVVDMAAAEPYALPKYDPHAGQAAVVTGIELHRPNRTTVTPRVLPDSSLYTDR